MALLSRATPSLSAGGVAFAVVHTCTSPRTCLISLSTESEVTGMPIDGK